MSENESNDSGQNSSPGNLSEFRRVRPKPEALAERQKQEIHEEVHNPTPEEIEASREEARRTLHQVIDSLIDGNIPYKFSTNFEWGLDVKRALETGQEIKYLTGIRHMIVTWRVPPDGSV